MRPPDRHTAPALWLVALAVVGATVLGATSGGRVGATVLVATLVTAAVARLVLRGRRPEGVAVRSTWQDVATLLVLAVGIGVLMLTPGV